jgi:hypothetical protein
MVAAARLGAIRASVVFAGLLFWFAFSGGCGGGLGLLDRNEPGSLSSSGSPDGNSGSVGSPGRGEALSSGNDREPNNGFSEAVLLQAAGTTRIALLGQIDVAGDVDVFDVGALVAGDRIILDLVRFPGTLRPVVALFDLNETLLGMGWDLSGPGEPRVSKLMDVSARHATQRAFLAVAQTYQNAGLGGYRLDVSVVRTGFVPAPRPQTIVLEFHGGEPGIPLLGIQKVAAFDASQIARVYSGQEETVKRAVVETVRANFAEFDVLVLTSDHGIAADDRSVTRLFIGSRSSAALGASQGIDAYNEDPCDDGIVFAESFTPALFGQLPSAEALGAAIGNVASHEAGHLLGLRHVSDSSAIMDERSPAVSLLGNQEFKTSPLSPSVFPFGNQDDRRLLAETVGLRD